MTMAVSEVSLESASLLFERDLDTLYGRWHEFLFRYANTDIIALCFGDWRSRDDVLVRIHSTCTGAHYLFSIECDCREQLDIAARRIVDVGVGIIVFLDQDGRGNGHSAVMRAAVYARQHSCTQTEAYASLGYPGDSRSFTGAGIVLRKLGVSSVLLMTNNPSKLDSIANMGITVRPMQIMASTSSNPLLNQYYAYKVQEGHSVVATTQVEAGNL